MRKMLSGLAVVALACATGTAAFAQTNGTPNGVNGGTEQPAANSQPANSQYPTSAQGIQNPTPVDKDRDNDDAAKTNGTMNRSMNGSGSVNGSVNGAGTTGAPVPAVPGSVNANGQTMVDVHDPTWQYEMMARQYHWSAPPPRTGGTTTTRTPQ